MCINLNGKRSLATPRSFPFVDHRGRHRVAPARAPLLVWAGVSPRRRTHSLVCTWSSLALCILRQAVSFNGKYNAKNYLPYTKRFAVADYVGFTLCTLEPHQKNKEIKYTAQTLYVIVKSSNAKCICWTIMGWIVWKFRLVCTSAVGTC